MNSHYFRSQKGLWLHPSPLVLASQSAARRELLESSGIPILLAPTYADERIGGVGIWGGGNPKRVSEFLALCKAHRAGAEYPDSIVLGGDQVLVSQGRIYSKPISMDVARRQLRELSGQTHHLISSAVAVHRGRLIFCVSEIAQLKCRVFGGDFIDTYLATAGESILGCVGGYQAEGLGIQLFERIEGEHSTVLGLPLMSVLNHFRRQGWIPS